MNDETEITNLIRIFQQFGIYRNILPKEHNEFVKEQLQKDYDIVLKTYVLQGKTYTGTYREDSHRKDNKEAYQKESKLATVLASMGFDVILIEEDNTKPGTKPDAIVNGIVMDFKEIKALNEHEIGKNALGHNYQDGIHKAYSEGVVIYLHNFSEGFVKNNMSFEKTSPTHNGIALFFHEDSGKLQLIDMEKVRAAHFEQNMPRKTPDTFIEPSDIKIACLEQLQSTAPDVSIEPHQLNNISQRDEKSSGNELLRQKQKSLENTKTKKNRRNGEFGFER